MSDFFGHFTFYQKGMKIRVLSQGEWFYLDPYRYVYVQEK